MQINLNVKIKAGLRTPVEVDVQRTSVNKKIIKFANGCKISELEILEIAGWIEENLRSVLQDIEFGI